MFVIYLSIYLQIMFYTWSYSGQRFGHNVPHRNLASTRCFFCFKWDLSFWTLDLVITESAPLNAPFVYDLGVSDHKVISMELPLLSSYIKREIRFRNLKNINTEDLSVSLQHLNSADFSSATESVEFYNKTLSSFLDFHAPIKVRTVMFSRSAPWFTSDLWKMKAAGRALERQYKASGLTVYKLAYRDYQKAYSKSIKEARSQYY